jgi:hypothetical protein
VAKRETVADKLKRKLEEQKTAGMLEVTENRTLEEGDILKPADNSYSYSTHRNGNCDKKVIS